MNINQKVEDQESQVIEAPKTTEEKKKKGGCFGWGWGKTIIIIVILIIVYNLIGVYSIQPIGALPEGVTMIVWRASGEPFFNSPDAVCLEVQGYVSLLCRGMAIAAAPVDRKIISLPYMHWTYLISTGGIEFEQ